MKTKILLLLLLVSSTRMLGQIGFQENLVIESTGPANTPLNTFEEIVTADLDGDGDLDIVTYGRDTVLWYENKDGQGDFEKHIIALDINGASSLAIGDLDGDGDLDVVSSSSADQFILWFENTDGSGTFGPPIIAHNSLAYYILLSDVDNDGDIDIVFRTGSRPYWTENLDGMGNFGPRQSISDLSAPEQFSSIFLTDVDNDGDDDLITLSTTLNQIAFFKNLGAGTFSDKQIIANNTNSVWKINSSDLDGDGDMDIITSPLEGSNFGWYENTDGQGTYGNFQIITSSVQSISSISVADIDGDGDQDLLPTSFDGNGNLTWIENMDGLGTFGNEHSIIDVSSGTKKAVMADLDSNNYLDILLIDYGGREIGWMKNIDSQGNFGLQNTIDVAFVGNGSIRGSDMDADGDADIISMSNVGLLWSENKDGQGLFGTFHMISDIRETIRNYDIGDIDNDGDNDVMFATSSDEQSIFWRENIYGDGTYFVTHVVPFDTFPTASYSIHLTDIDGDGDLDILSRHSGNTFFLWMENIDGAGTFGPEHIVSSPSNTNVKVIISADIDEDNDMDVVLATGNTLIWFENTDGQGTFGESQMIASDVTNPNNLKSVDMDGDGDLDIAYSSDSEDKIAWYENLDGQGVFGIKHIISSGFNGPRSIFPADIDGDGNMDMLAAFYNARRIMAFYNINGQSTVQSFDTNAINALDTFAIDIDGDNDLDIVSMTGLGNNKIKWFENLRTVGNQISGTIRYDLENNGCQDDTSQNLSSFLVIADNGTDSFSTFSQSSGEYSLLTSDGTYNISLANQQQEYLATTPSSYTTTFNGLDDTFNADFCINSSISTEDLFISVYPSFGNFIFLGQDETYHIVFGNVGTSQIDGTIRFQYENNRIQFLGASEEVTSQTINTLNFDFSNLNPSETRTLDINFNVYPIPINQLGSNFNSTTTIYPNVNDNTVSDNTFILNQIGISSFDPNDITCLEGDQVLIENSDKYLHYLIRFQNTGNADAFNIRVENTLDNKLDWTSMQLESLSHDGRVEIRDGSEVKFNFNNINLPDSTSDEPNSHGFIAYKIKPMDNVVVGEIVNNTAEIYFDFNPPIITNTASTEFLETLSVAEFDTNQFTVYPNPTNSILNIKGNTNIEAVTIIDINGRILKKFNFDNPTLNAQIDITELKSGIYFLNIKSNERNINKKIIKR